MTTIRIKWRGLQRRSRCRKAVSILWSLKVHSILNRAVDFIGPKNEAQSMLEYLMEYHKEENDISVSVVEKDDLKYSMFSFYHYNAVIVV